ncbi:MAG: RdgB/HAM1 family non-canonical purine NTP pyrophosphatase [Bacteroidota bacterium]
MKKLFLATGNPHKLEEFNELFEGLSIELSMIPVDVEENGKTFQENALIKARAGCASSHEATLADDSGLAVDALDGAPGIHSARYAPTKEARIEKLLDALEGVPDPARTAAFHCALAVVWPDGRELSVEGKCPGVINHAPVGSEGFGYDPVFFLPELNKTFAELSSEEKNRLSHRGRAAHLLLDALRSAGFLE